MAPRKKKNNSDRAGHGAWREVSFKYPSKGLLNGLGLNAEEGNENGWLRNSLPNTV